MLLVPLLGQRRVLLRGGSPSNPLPPADVGDTAHHPQGTAEEPVLGEGSGGSQDPTHQDKHPTTTQEIGTMAHRGSAGAQASPGSEAVGGSVTFIQTLLLLPSEGSRGGAFISSQLLISQRDPESQPLPGPGVLG